MNTGHSREYIYLSLWIDTVFFFFGKQWQSMERFDYMCINYCILFNGVANIFDIIAS